MGKPQSTFGKYFRPAKIMDSQSSR